MKSRPPRNTPAAPAESPFSRRLAAALEAPWWRLPLSLALLALLLAAWTFDPKLALSGDNTEFMTLARSLVQGEGLSYISLPAPKPATKYPFGFPLMLAPLEWLFPGQWVPMNWLVVCLFAASIPVFYFLARDQVGPLPALLAALWCLSIPALLDYAHQVMSEIPYLLFSLLALWLIERSVGAQRAAPLRGNYWFIGGFACMMWAYYVRSVGLVLVAAIFLYLLLGRCFRQALVLGGGALALALPWWLRSRALGDEGSYFKQLLSVNPYFPEQGTVGLGELAERLQANVQAYLAQVLPGVFWPSLESPGSAFNLVSILLLAAGSYAAVVCLRQRQHVLLLLYAALYLGTVLLWPAQWADARFLVPIAPVVVFFVIRVGMDLLERLERRGLGPAGALALAAGLVGVLAVNTGALRRLDQAGEGNYPPAWRNYYAAGQWLRANTPADAVIACRKDYWLYIVSGRPCMVYPFKEPEAVIASLEEQGVDFVVVEQLGFSSTPRFLVPAIQKYPERFAVVWQQPNPDTFILRFLAKK